MATPGPVIDAARRLVVERTLVATAFEHLTVDAFMTLPFEALGPTKALVKQFFSTGPWGPDDDEALADAVGAGEGHWHHSLDDDLALEYGWDEGRFRLWVGGAAAVADDAVGAEVAAGAVPGAGRDEPLAATFDGPVVPEATPNPRTIRFQVGPVHDGPSRWYESVAEAVVADDAGAAPLFSRFPEVANVLVGPDFVAVGLHRATDWERMLRPILAVVTEEFASPEAPSGPTGPRVTGGPGGAGAAVTATGAGVEPGAGHRGSTRLEQAWRDLGERRPADPADLAVVEGAAAGDDPARRQVAASLLREAGAATAAAHWSRLVTDPVRSVRRAAVDAMVDVRREELRPVLEGALADADAWVRWKALRGLAELGADPSRDAIAVLADDADFRVRLEVAAALRADG